MSTTDKLELLNTTKKAIKESLIAKGRPDVSNVFSSYPEEIRQIVSKDEPPELIYIENMVTNGNFSDTSLQSSGLPKGWSYVATSGTIETEIIGNTLRLKRETANRIIISSGNIVDKKDTYYMTADLKFDEDTKVKLTIGNTPEIEETTIGNKWESLSFVSPPNNRPGFEIWAGSLAANINMYIKNVIGINLTKTFGAGFEPSKETMDTFIAKVGFFDGEKGFDKVEFDDIELTTLQHMAGEFIVAQPMLRSAQYARKNNLIRVDELTEEEYENMIGLYSPWEMFIGQTIPEGTIVRYEGVLYQVVKGQTHKVEKHLDPVSMNYGYVEIPPVNAIPEWFPVDGYQDAQIRKKGYKMTYNGKVYESLIDGNTQEPTMDEPHNRYWKEV